MFTTLSAVETSEAIDHVRVFHGLSERSLTDIKHISTLGYVDKGHLFYNPGATSEYIYILLQGRVDQYRINSHGRKLITTVLQPQATFDAASLLEEQIHYHYAEAMTQSLVLACQHQEFKRLILAHPKILLYMLAETQGRLTEIEEKLESIAFRRLLARLSELLLKLAEQQGHDRIVGYTHQDFAEILGTYRETTTQALNNLKALGYIAISCKRIDILNTRQLASAR